MIDDRQNWQTINLAAIGQRLAWLQQQPDGIIFCQDSGVHYVVVRKERSQIKLSLVEKVNLLESIGAFLPLPLLQNGT
jgi:spermidine synthase